MQIEENPKKIEQNAIISVWDDLGKPVPKKLFEKIWRCSRETGELANYAPEHFRDEDVLLDAQDAMQKLIEIAQLGWDAGAGGGRKRGGVKDDLREARQKLDDGGSLELSEQTSLRTDAMALLITELVEGQESVQMYREALPVGLLNVNQIDAFLDGQDEEEAGELLDIALEVCERYGLKLWQSLDIILAGLPPKLRAVHVGPPGQGSTVCRTHISFAPWTAPEDASATLRRAQLRRTALQEYKARAEKDKRAAMARVEAEEIPKARGIRPWLADPKYKMPTRRPRLDVSGRKLGGPKERSLRVFVSVSRQRREADKKLTWGELMEGFNAYHKDEKYTQVRSFTKTFKDARAALPAWLPTPRPRLALEQEGGYHERHGSRSK